MSGDKERARCPVCEREDVRLTIPAQRFVSHDRGFRGRARREQWRIAICPASGHTESEASLVAAREKLAAR